MKRALRLALLSTGLVAATTVPATATVSFDARVKAQRAIEEVYWRHRVWPSQNTMPKPALDVLMPADAITVKVERYLKQSWAVERIWHRPITREQLQAELDRMARDTRDPELLGELFDALGRDADLIGETLARQTLAERLFRSWTSANPTADLDPFWDRRNTTLSTEIDPVAHGLVLPALPTSACTQDTWSPTHTEMPDGRMNSYAVWTGTEMIVWGGVTEYGTSLNTGGRYSPATDSWVPTSITANTPPAAAEGSVVWTGTEMIVWGGYYPSFPNRRNSGARYNPATDVWTPTSTGANVPEARSSHTAVWTGTEMLIWGGATSTFPGPTTVGRYDPVTDSWTTGASSSAPTPRMLHSAVWAGTEMIVWGGVELGPGTQTNTGGRYDPASDTWTPTALGGAPSSRQAHTAVWTGSTMIVWGGTEGNPGPLLSTGARYNPSSDSWSPTSVGTGVPGGRRQHSAVWTGSAMIIYGGATADPNAGASYKPGTDSWTTLPAGPLASRVGPAVVWTGSEMIVWSGGQYGQRPFNDGARFKPANDSWVPTSMGSVPVERESHSAVWTGTEMIIWGGRPTGNDDPALRSGGRYTPATDSWVPTASSAAPAARHRHAAVWTGREMIVWAGRNASTLNSGGRYDPANDSWRPTSVGANLPTPREHPVAVWSGTEMIIFGDASVTGGRYDPRLDTWTPTAAGPTIVGDSQVAVWSGTEMLVYQGGFGMAGRYDPATNTWETMSPAPLSNRMSSTAVWTGTEMIVWGGSDSNTGARYNPAANVWTPTSTGANVATARQAHSAVWTGSEMLVWGGANLNAAQNPTRGSRYDPVTDAWQPMSPGPGQPTQRTWHSAIWTGSSMIIWGGNITTATGALYCACPDGRIVYRDADGDGFGDAGVPAPSCSGAVPAGYAATAGDCNDASAAVHPGAAETCNGIDDDCDGLVDDGASVEDADGDRIRDACDDCPLAYDPAQTDQNQDGEGDACDANDGEIFLAGPGNHDRVEWQPESGETSWNVYHGDMAVLRSFYFYTQAPGSNALAARYCGLTQPWLDDATSVPPGKTRFTLVTGVTGGVEGSLGYDCQGNLRLNHNPCP